MKHIVLDVPYGCQLVLPVEIAGFLPQMFLVEVEGYGDDRVFYRTGKPFGFSVIEAEIHACKPADPPPPHPPSDPLTSGIKDRPANATAAYQIKDDDVPF